MPYSKDNPPPFALVYINSGSIIDPHCSEAIVLDPAAYDNATLKERLIAAFRLNIAVVISDPNSLFYGQQVQVGLGRIRPYFD